MSIKTLLKSDGVRRVACWIGAQYIRFVYVTGRWKTVRGDTPQRLWEEGRPFIVSLWHGRLLMMPYCWSHKAPINVLTSQHRDGQMIANTVAHFGIGAVYGSSSKGGAQALRTMVKALKAGESIGIAPDGPRGPRMRASGGIVSVARLAGVPVIPATYSIRAGRILGSWDSFLIAAPFSHGVIVWGTPIKVPRDADDQAQERIRHDIETSMNTITAEADSLVGRTPISPAAEAPGKPIG